MKEKNADEMFEELGYKKHIRYLNHKEDEIDYTMNYKYATNIKFDVIAHTILIYQGKDDTQSGYIQLETLQAINLKVKELRLDRRRI